jgi:hypothetical protein
MITVVKSGKIGSKAEVYHGTKEYTNGGLRKKDIVRVKDKQGNYRYKSRNQIKTGKKNSFIKNWANYAYRETACCRATEDCCYKKFPY